MQSPRFFSALLLAGIALAACKSDIKSDSSSDKDAASASSASSAGASPNAVLTPPQPSAIPAPPDVAAPPPDAQKTASGLASKVITPGTGTEHPKPEDTVKVHYTGWTSDGKMFDSSVTRGQPIDFPLNGVIKGWTEGVQLMVVGEKRRFWIPAELAYGAHPPPGAPAGQLTFDVELLGITKAVPPPPTPPDVKAPPPDAKKTASGLAYKYLTKGTGTQSPTANDRVTVNYTGWTTDGHMFDSSTKHGGPAHFQAGRLVPGFTEALLLMHVGDKIRVWIPAKLAYGDKPSRPGAPAGMLVFEIELVSIP